MIQWGLTALRKTLGERFTYEMLREQSFFHTADVSRYSNMQHNVWVIKLQVFHSDYLVSWFTATELKNVVFCLKDAPSSLLRFRPKMRSHCLVQLLYNAVKLEYICMHVVVNIGAKYKCMQNQNFTLHPIPYATWTYLSQGEMYHKCYCVYSKKLLF